jgi:hypothetical protein
MSFLDIVTAKVGKQVYSRLETVAEKEVALAVQMPLADDSGRENFYTQRFLLDELLVECELFESAGLKISPIDVVNALFRCKLLFASRTEREYHQRCGGFPLFEDFPLRWAEKAAPIDVLIDKCITWLEGRVMERILVSHVSSFQTIPGDGTTPQTFLESLFPKLGLPFVSFLDDGRLIDEHKKFEPGLRSYDQVDANRFFSAPSIGFKVSGSRNYCFWYSSMWLRTFLHLLRIAGYVHPGQRSFGRDAVMKAPTYPVFLGEHSTGVLKWDEDKRESWAKIPDGCLSLSFGYRGLADMWLDRRTFPKIEHFMIDHRAVFTSLKNPWSARSLRDVAPALDILSSATHIPDLGAKILLVYCCLEHLFVPQNAFTENKKYIIGGMNALGPQLLPWFDRLYNLRCNYAHKGFVLRDQETMGLVADSMKNAMTLLVAKLSVA